MNFRSFFAHVGKLSLVLVVLLAVAALQGRTAQAAKPGGSDSSSINLDQVDQGPYDPASGPSLGSEVTFTSTYPKSVKNPRIEVLCYHTLTGVLVYAEAGTYEHVFLLGGGWSEWLMAPGPAYCDANLFYFVWHGNNPQEYVWLASTSFDAGG